MSSALTTKTWLDEWGLLNPGCIQSGVRKDGFPCDSISLGLAEFAELPRKVSQIHLAQLLPQSWNQPFLPEALAALDGAAFRNHTLHTRGIHCCQVVIDSRLLP